MSNQGFNLSRLNPIADRDLHGTNRLKRFLRGFKLVHAICLVSATSLAQSSVFADPTTAPIIESNDLTYLGAFRVPSGGSSATFEYGGGALGYNPVTNSIFMVGPENNQRTAEISIPQVVNSTNLSSLNTATFIQGFADSTEGKRSQINPSDPNPQLVGGNLVFGNKLIVSAFSFYDGSGSQSASHFSRPLSLSATGEVKGPFRVGDDAHLTSAYMTHIPPEWQSLLGGPALTGNCCRSIISHHSHGPAVSVFNPGDLGVTNPVPAHELLHYTDANPLGPGGTVKNPYWNWATRIEGIVFPQGTRSVLFFGQHGIGEPCYGDGSECGDPADPYKGNHAYPYKYQVWAYDANDLVKVKNGTMRAVDVIPYSVWHLDLPFSDPTQLHKIGGAVYDAASNRIYVSQPRGEGTLPVIHVFEVKLLPRPTPPGDLFVQ